MDAPRVEVKPGEGRSVSLGGMGVVFKISGADTGGAFAVVEHPIEPGRLVPPHVHVREDEYSSWRERSVRGSVTGRLPQGRAPTCSSRAGWCTPSGTPAPARPGSWR
jgi:hypothetical protein